MGIFKNCIFYTKYFEKNKILVFDVSYEKIEFDNISFIVNPSHNNILFEMNKITYKSIHSIYIDQKKILVDFFSNIKINIKKNKEIKILSGIIIPYFNLNRWNKISIFFNRKIFKDKLPIYILNSNIIQYMKINFYQNKNINQIRLIPNKEIYNLNNANVISNLSEKKQCYNGEEIKNIFIGINKMKALDQI